MQIKLVRAPLSTGYAPEPINADEMLPDWVAAMPAAAGSEGAVLPTAKRCSPFIDAMTHGFLLRLATDVTFDGVRLTWPETDLATPHFRGPLSFHEAGQVTGSPLAQGGRRIVKFHNYWSIEAEPGWSVLFTHPFHRFDLPFQTISGLVDLDSYGQLPVHTPAVWHASEPCLLTAGTPVAQCIPIKRASLDLKVVTPTAKETLAAEAMLQYVATNPHAYRRRFRTQRKEAVPLDD